MNKAKRVLLWGLVLSPVAILPLAFVASRLWLNQQLQRELVFGSLAIRLINPSLGWDINFSSDSVEMSTPDLTVRTGKVTADIRLWNSLVSFRPSVKAVADTIRIQLEPRSREDSLDVARKKKLGKVPIFPNIRIPLAFRFTAAKVELADGNKRKYEVFDFACLSQGFKGIELAASGFALPGPKESTLMNLDASVRVSARWFGKFLTYQIHAKANSEDLLDLTGERLKSNLRMGKDSVALYVADLSHYSRFFSGKGLPQVTQISFQGALKSEANRTIRIRLAALSPSIWKVGPQQIDLQADLDNLAGRFAFKGDGMDQEQFALQGKFLLPSLDSAWSHISSNLSAEVSGYSRNVRIPMGKKRVRILPGDVEIRSLKILPGLGMEMEALTSDGSHFFGRAFRQNGMKGVANSDSSWKLSFQGTVDPKEAWVHAWVDTNVAFTQARVVGEVGKGGMRAEAWFNQPRAYGVEGDSLYTQQTLTSKGYYLRASRLMTKDGVWPISGQVEWGKRIPRDRTDSAASGLSKTKRAVSLSFQTQHARYGYLQYSMPEAKSLSVRAENLQTWKLPYTRLSKVLALQPTVTGNFQWNILSRSGFIDAKTAFSYRGRDLGVTAVAAWNSQSFRADTIDIKLGASLLRFAGKADLHGRQFWQMGKLGIENIQSLSMEAQSFDASGLGLFLGERNPVGKGFLNGKLTYTDSTGFLGTYEVLELSLGPVHKLFTIPRLALIGQGESLQLTMRTASMTYPWLNDTLTLKVNNVLGKSPGISLEAVSKEGLSIFFKGHAPEFQSIDGEFSVRGNAALPGQAGLLKDLRLSGHFQSPFNKRLLKEMVLESDQFAGRYALPGLDTQTFSGTISLRDGQLRIPDLRAANKQGTTLSGEAYFDLTGPPVLTAKLRGDNLALRWPGIQKLILQDAEASLRVDSTGLSAEARVGRAEFASAKPPISTSGRLENLSIDFYQPPLSKSPRGASLQTFSAAGVNQPSAVSATPIAAAVLSRIAKVKVKAKLRNFQFKHKIGFRELQRSIRTVKVDKRKKRIKPFDVQIDLETTGAENRIETDILRMFFVGDVNVRGVYPYTLLSGEFSALSGELGQTSQSYDITDFGLKWQNATVEEGRISVEGSKRLRADCNPDTKRTCKVYVKLVGRLDDMAFSYDTDCGGSSGETMEPSALINSVSRGCYSDQYVAGAGGGNYGEAVFVLLEPTINEKLTRVGDRFSGGWIKRTSVSGIGSAVSGDTTGSEPISIGVESVEKWGVSLKAKAGYHPEKKVLNQWENKVSAEWRPPLERASRSSEWKRLVRDRVTLEASAETRPEEKVDQENREVRKQVGIRYRYTFWNFW